MKGDSVGGPVRWRVHLPASPEIVYQALDSDAGRAAFWAESAVERDGMIDFRFANGESYHARILERRRPDLFSVEYFSGIVRFELTSDRAGGTDLLLTHTGIALDDWHDVHAGWLNVLFPLKAWLMDSIDLRNHDPERTWDQGYADQ